MYEFCNVTLPNAIAVATDMYIVMQLETQGSVCEFRHVILSMAVAVGVLLLALLETENSVYKSRHGLPLGQEPAKCFLGALSPRLDVQGYPLFFKADLADVGTSAAPIGVSLVGFGGASPCEESYGSASVATSS